MKTSIAKLQNAQAVSRTKTPNRDRYAAKEQDEEGGLYYEGARYSPAWLGGWTSGDPVGFVDGTTKNQAALLTDPNGTQAMQGSHYLENKNKPEYKVFEANVGGLKDQVPAPTTAKEKTEDKDIFTKVHDEAVKKVINKALKLSIKHFTDQNTKKVIATKEEIIDYALTKLVVPLRERSLEDSQSLIFRDADHYFTGWRQEWQRTGLIYEPFKYRGTEREVERLQEGRKADPKASGFLVPFSGIVAWGYDAKKIWDFKQAAKGNGNGGTSLDTSRLPASAAGGRHWTDLGNEHFMRDKDDMSKQEAPALLIKTPFENMPKQEAPAPLIKTPSEIMPNSVQKLPVNTS